MLVFFNDPVQLDDPAWNAVRLAIAMRDRTAELSRQWRRRGHELTLGIGIAVGYATCGEIGFEGRTEYTAIGTVVNLAARVCAIAPGGADPGHQPRPRGGRRPCDGVEPRRPRLQGPQPARAALPDRRRAVTPVGAPLVGARSLCAPLGLSLRNPSASFGPCPQNQSPRGARRGPSGSARPRSAAARRSPCRACAPPRRATSTPPSRRSHQLQRAGADVVRIAVDNDKEVDALEEIRRQTDARTSPSTCRRTTGSPPTVGAARRQDPLQPRPPAPPRARQAGPRQGRVARRRRARQRLRDPHRRELRLGRARVPRALPRRSARGHGRSRPCDHCELLEELGFTRFVVSLKDSDPRQGGRGQPALRRRAPRRAAAPRRHRGGHAAGRHHQDAASPSSSCSRRASATRSASR